MQWFVRSSDLSVYAVCPGLMTPQWRTMNDNPGEEKTTQEAWTTHWLGHLDFTQLLVFLCGLLWAPNSKETQQLKIEYSLKKNWAFIPHSYSLSWFFMIFSRQISKYWDFKKKFEPCFKVSRDDPSLQTIAVIAPRGATGREGGNHWICWDGTDGTDGTM